MHWLIINPEIIMQIPKISFSHLTYGQNFQQSNSTNLSFTSRPSVDTFSKSVSFGESQSPKIEKVLDILATSAVIGTPLVLSLAGGIWLAKGDDPSIYLRNNRYVYDPVNESVKSKDIDIEPHKGIYKINGTKIDIDPQKYNYDYVDVEKGIFKNYDGSVDIDMSNNKIIDVNNGIFIDPDSQISMVVDGGTAHDIIIPSFKGSSMSPSLGWIGPSEHDMETGQGYLTRDEYIARYGVKPEDSKFADEIREHGRIRHNEESFWDRMKKFFTGDSGNRYDVFGRKIYSYTDENGHVYRFPMDEETARLVENHSLDITKVPALINEINQYKHELYIAEHPQYAHAFRHVDVDDIDNFVHNTSTSDAIADHTQNSAEHAQSIIEHAKDAVEQSAPPGVWEEIHEHLINILENGVG